MQTEGDGLNLIEICAHEGTNMLLIHSDRLSADFFNLKTGIAGAIMLKLSQYAIKVAILLDKEDIGRRFKEYIAESNRGNLFHTYKNISDAENWLIENK